MEWRKTLEVCGGRQGEVDNEAVLAAWVCGQQGEIDGGWLRERERERRSEEKQTRERERERYVLRKERDKLDKLIK